MVLAFNPSRTFFRGIKQVQTNTYPFIEKERGKGLREGSRKIKKLKHLFNKTPSTKYFARKIFQRLTELVMIPVDIDNTTKFDLCENLPKPTLHCPLIPANQKLILFYLNGKSEIKSKFALVLHDEQIMQ